MSSLRQKVRSGRYSLGLVAVSGGFAFAAIHPTAGTVNTFGTRYPDKGKAIAEGQRKFKQTATLVGPETVAEPAPDLNTLTVDKLRELAKGNGIKGYSKLKKGELIAALSPLRAAA